MKEKILIGIIAFVGCMMSITCNKTYAADEMCYDEVVYSYFLEEALDEEITVIQEVIVTKGTSEGLNSVEDYSIMVDEVSSVQSENGYTELSYEYTKNISARYASTGQTVLLFTHTMNGKFYYYDDGKVHLYSLYSFVSNVRPGYSAVITNRQINNTDGSLSCGESTVVTSSSLSGYPTPTLHFGVRFEGGSTNYIGSVIEQY